MYCTIQRLVTTTSMNGHQTNNYTLPQFSATPSLHECNHNAGLTRLTLTCSSIQTVYTEGEVTHRPPPPSSPQLRARKLIGQEEKKKKPRRPRSLSSGAGANRRKTLGGRGGSSSSSKVLEQVFWFLSMSNTYQVHQKKMYSSTSKHDALCVPGMYSKAPTHPHTLPLGGHRPNPLSPTVGLRIHGCLRELATTTNFNDNENDPGAHNI